VKDIDADFVTMSGHKFYAPKGIGALYIKKGKRLDPLLTGGHQENNRRAGTENVVGMVAMGAALELATGEMAADRERIGKIRDEFERRVLAEVPHARRNGGAGNRLYTTSNISFRFVEGEAIQLKLDYHGIAVSTGSACSSGTLDPSHVITAMCHDDEDAHSSIRFSFGKYSKMEEIDYVINRLQEVIAQLRSFSPLYDKFMNPKGK
jgi:cysteine desulfurase